MKNLKCLAIIVICLSFSACIDGQFRRTIRGNHNVVRKEREAGSFSGLSVNTNIDVFLSQGDKTGITVEADGNLHEYLVTEIRDDVLRVYFDANVINAKASRIYLTMKDINYLSTSSSGDINGQTPVTTGPIKISSSSAGDIKLDIRAKDITVNCSSAGDITLSGETDRLDASLSSAGDLNAFDLTCKEAVVEVSSAGNADINVTGKLTARASSAGSINYKGDPAYLDARSSSAGGVHKR